MEPREKIIERLQKDGKKIIELFSSFSKEQMECLIYFGEMDWQVKDIFAHFISAERSFLLLFKNIQDNYQGFSDDFIINEFNNTQVMNMKNNQFIELINAFKETRTQTINWLKSASEEDLNKTGRHPTMGEVKILEMVKMINLHNQKHIRDIKLSFKDQKSYRIKT